MFLLEWFPKITSNFKIDRQYTYTTRITNESYKAVNNNNMLKYLSKKTKVTKCHVFKNIIIILLTR